jgi:hypothetical protein
MAFARIIGGLGWRLRRRRPVDDRPFGMAAGAARRRARPSAHARERYSSSLESALVSPDAADHENANGSAVLEKISGGRWLLHLLPSSKSEGRSAMLMQNAIRWMFCLGLVNCNPAPPSRGPKSGEEASSTPHRVGDSQLLDTPTKALEDPAGDSADRSSDTAQPDSRQSEEAVSSKEAQSPSAQAPSEPA